MSNFWISASEGNLNAVRNYIENQNISVNAADPQGYTAIHAAASYDHIELLNYLFGIGGDPNVQDHDGDTPLHHCENVETAKVLVQHGANWSIKNKDGLAPAAYIIEDGDFPELGKYLQCLETTGNAEKAWGMFSAKDVNIEGFENQIKTFLSAPESELGPEMSEQRKQLEVIMSNQDLSDADRDEKLKEYVMEILGGHMGELTNANEFTGDEERSSKRRK